MTCYNPLVAFRTPQGDVIFSDGKADTERQIMLPCGRCVGCRMERSRQWAIRCVHEASLYKRNCFITLTYDDAHLPEDQNLIYRDFQLFMKRLRRRFPVSEPGIRFYMCGEYGEDYGRPHFHSCLFNFDFADKVFIRAAKGDARLYSSSSLESLWPHGFSSVGAVTRASAAYVARYVMKKAGEQADLHRLVTPDGVVRTPEFNHMSLKPGIGAGWLLRFESDVYPRGMVVVDGREVRPPKFYDKRFAKSDPDGYAQVSLDREKYSRDRFADSSPERLAVREVVAKAAIRSLKRSL